MSSDGHVHEQLLEMYTLLAKHCFVQVIKPDVFVLYSQHIDSEVYTMIETS